MANIIKQLEEGKRIQEEQGIDAASLRTKINSEEENEPVKEKKKRGRKKKEEHVEQQEQSSTTEKSSAQVEQATEESESKEEQKPVKHPEFDFNDYYEKGQVIFYIKVNRILGTKDFYSLKIRTIYPNMIVACEEGKAVQCIGYDTKDMIFTSRTIAKQEYDKIEIAPRFTPSKLKLEEDETENEENKDTDC